MQAIDLLFKNGHRLEGLIWTWEPSGGWFEALDEKDGKIRKYWIKDVQDGKIYADRIRIQAQAQSFLELAKSEGYNN